MTAERARHPSHQHECGGGLRTRGDLLFVGRKRMWAFRLVDGRRLCESVDLEVLIAEHYVIAGAEFAASDVHAVDRGAVG
jgi:hypothetical protein